MGFGIGKEGPGIQNFRTQSEIVAAQTEAKPSFIEEKLNLPGIKLMHLMNESELIDFLLVAIRIRPAIVGINISLGNYQFTERESTVPNVTRFLEGQFPILEKIQSIVASLSYSSSVCGIRLVPVLVNGQLIGNKAYLRIANKIPVGHEYDESGTLIKEGDEEFDPTLTVSYIP